MESKVLIIAEAGVNHNGDMVLAKKLIDGAKYAGADIVKFQTWITEEIVTTDAPKAEYQKVNDGDATSQFEMLKKLELNFSQFHELQQYCNKTGIRFLSTADDYKSLDFLVEELKLDLLKIGSGEVTNLPFLKRFAQKKKPVILSTGMSDMQEVKAAYEVLIKNGAPHVTVLHCTSNYPASFDSVNLKAMLSIKKELNTEIGYSDHTLGFEVSLAAVALGAKVIEKHFTIDKTLPGPDHAASLNIEELKAMVSAIRNIEMALSGSGIKQPHASERDIKKIVQKGIYASRDLSKGKLLTEEDIVLKRPVTGLTPDMLYSIVGKRLKVDLKKNEPLTTTQFE